MQWFFRAVLIFAIFIFIPAQATWAFEPFDCSPYEDVGIYVVERPSGDVLISHNHTQPYAPLSITKVLCAITFLDYYQPDEQIIATPAILSLVQPDSSVANLVYGETLTTQQIIYAMLLPSGNDAARIAAVNSGRRILDNQNTNARDAMNTFVEAMNQKAVALGMVNSNFVNPDGYPTKDMYSTAADINILCLYAIENYPLINQAVGDAYIKTVTDKKEHFWVNSNLLMLETTEYMSWIEGSEPNVYYDPRVNGIKTGNGDGQRSFAFSAEQDGHILVGSLLHVSQESEQDIFTIAESIINWYFTTYQAEIASEIEQEQAQDQNGHDGQRRSLHFWLVAFIISAGTALCTGVWHWFYYLD